MMASCVGCLKDDVVLLEGSEGPGGLGQACLSGAAGAKPRQMIREINEVAI